jgi:NitT/TauT family transport system substrate-binding protein
VPTDSQLNRAAFLAGASAFTLASRPAKAADGLTPLAIGTLPSAGDAVVNYAYDNGYFKDLGIDANVALMNNGNVIWTAVLGRSLEIGAGNIGSLAVARSKGIPLKVIAPAAIATNANPLGFILVRKGSTIRSGADFNNKMVATVAITTAGEASIKQAATRRRSVTLKSHIRRWPRPSMRDAPTPR